jgi:hypothetical protein
MAKNEAITVGGKPKTREVVLMIESEDLPEGVITITFPIEQAQQIATCINEVIAELLQSGQRMASAVLQ